MCTHQKFVYNRFTRSVFLVKCGKCKACLQEKAYKRSSRIKNEYSPDRIVLFVTLTYDRSSCPFVLQSDLDSRSDVLPVYREHSTRRVRVHVGDKVCYLNKRLYGRVKLGEVVFPDYDSFMSRPRIRHLAFRSRHVGVCYYPDVQNFKKRLLINLRRKYNFNEKIKIYSCSEYGESTGRPHFHLLIFIRPNDEATFRTAIPEAWPYASMYRTQRGIELARDCANYVSSYINSGTHLHEFLSHNFKAKHSYSKGFGFRPGMFSLDSLLKKIDERDLSYLRQIGPKGKEELVDFPIPKYVINKYFPLFKGYSRFTDTEVLDVLRCFIRPFQEPIQVPLIDLDHLIDIDYTKEDLYKISVRLRNSFWDFNRLTGKWIEDYIWYFYNAWKVYKSTVMRFWYEDDIVDWKYKFDNTVHVFNGSLYSPFVKEWLSQSIAKVIAHPNDYPQNINKTNLYTQIYDFRCKEKKINNVVLAQKYYYF